MDKNDIIVAVFLDLRRAFETVNRTLLLKKLCKIGFSGNVLKWFNSYLNDRVQNVKYGNAVSKSLNCNYGVPQGTVLGPLLFILYINDIVKYVKNCKICMFADDMMLYVSGSDIHKMIETINKDLDTLYSWLSDNSLCLNINKSKFIVIGNKIKIANLQYNVQVKIKSTILEQVREIKYLGILIDENLNFRKHLNCIMSKISRKVYFLTRISKHVSIFSKSLLYKALILPHINFCSTILFNLPLNEQQKLQKLQNRAMRAILKCNRYTPINIMLETLNFMNIKQLITYRTFDFIYKIKYKMVPTYLTDNVKFVSDVHNYSTRGKNETDFYVDKCNTSKCLNNLCRKGLIMYNSLTPEIKCCENYVKFKRLLYIYVTEHV